MILVIAGIKGGIGKSTTAANIAVLAARDGQKVMLIDADSDDQHTTMRWAQERNENPFVRAPVTTMALFGKSIRAELLRLDELYDLIVVDPAARDSETQRLALSAADVALMPFAPRGPELWTGEGMVTMLQFVRSVNPGLRAAAFLNKADSKGRNNEQAEEALAGFADSFDLLGVRIGNRIAIHDAHLAGLSVVELPRPDAKAVAELTALYEALAAIASKGPKEP